MKVAVGVRVYSPSREQREAYRHLRRDLGASREHATIVVVGMILVEARRPHTRRERERQSFIAMQRLRLSGLAA